MLTAAVAEEDLNRLIYLIGSKMIDPSKREYIWTAMLRRALSLNRKRVRQQKNLDGSPFQARKNLKKSKMFKAILRERNKKGYSQFKMAVGQDSGQLTLNSLVAVKHQYGLTQQVKAFNKAQMAEHFKDSPKGGCSRRQAQMLKRYYRFKWILLGPSAGPKGRLKPKKTGAPRRKPRRPKNALSTSISNIQKGFTIAEAGVMIKRWRQQNGQPIKTSWSIKLAPRHILGLSPGDKVNLTEYLDQLLVKYQTETI